jgi:hypothetical protein
MIPYVRPKKHIFYRDWKRKDTSDNITIMRYRYNKIDESLVDFSRSFLEGLDEVCLDVEDRANEVLRRIVAQMAYVQYTTGEDDQVSYIPTLEFPESLNVIVSVGIDSGALHFDIEFNYRDLSVESYDHDFLPAHASIEGRDVREDMADILNTPITYYDWDYKHENLRPRGERKGRWYEMFDRWFRSYGEQLFLKLCRERGLI